MSIFATLFGQCFSWCSRDATEKQSVEARKHGAGLRFDPVNDVWVKDPPNVEDQTLRSPDSGLNIQLLNFPCDRVPPDAQPSRSLNLAPPREI
jgi:hypothetical protein